MTSSTIRLPAIIPILVALASAGGDLAAGPAAFSFATDRFAVAGRERGAVKVLSLGKEEVQWTQNLLPLTVGAKTTPLAEVSSLAFSPDGKRLAVGGGVLYHGHVALLDAARGKLLWVSRDIGHQHRVTLAFSPDGKILCAASLGGPVTLLDVGTGAIRRTLAAKRVVSVAFSPDGKQVAAATAGGKGLNEVRLWEAGTGKLLRTIPQGRGAIAFSPDGKLLATAGEDNAVSIWDAGTGKLKRTLKGKPAGVITFSRDGKTLACIEGQAGAVSLRDVATGERVRKLDDGPVSQAAFSQDGKVLVAWGSKGGLRRW
jgi:WD40 repeat protein